MICNNILDVLAKQFYLKIMVKIKGFFFHFVQYDIISNLFPCIPTVYFLISDNKSLPSNNKIITFYVVTAWHPHCHILAELPKISIFQGMISFDPNSKTFFSFAFLLQKINKNVRWKNIRNLWVAYVCPPPPPVSLIYMYVCVCDADKMTKNPKEWTNLVVASFDQGCILATSHDLKEQTY